MKRSSLLLAYILRLALLPAVFIPLFSIAQLSGKVISVTDGDTFTLLTANKQQVKIRLFGIDCPEIGQDYAEQARTYLGDLIFFDTVRVATKGLDESGATLGIVTLFKMNVNERMLQQGFAWHDTRFDTNPAWSAYAEKARQLKKGLWSSGSPIPPWVWKNTHKN